MGQPKDLTVNFIDKYGQPRTIHKTKGGLKLKRTKSTVPITLSNIAGPMIGARIRKARLRKRWSLTELCIRAGIVSTTPKSRMWEIETGSRHTGVRFGTLYALAIALQVPVTNLIPTVDEVLEAAEGSVARVVPATPQLVVVQQKKSAAA